MSVSSRILINLHPSSNIIHVTVCYYSTIAKLKWHRINNVWSLLYPRKAKHQVTVDTNQDNNDAWYAMLDPLLASRHHVMSEVLLLLLPTESLKLRPDPSVDIWVRSTVSGQSDQPIMCCPLLPPLTRILRALSQTKTCIIASTPSAGGMKDAVYSSIPSQPRENVRLRLELERLTRNWWVFPDCSKRIPGFGFNGQSYIPSPAGRCYNVGNQNQSPASGKLWHQATIQLTVGKG